MVWTKRVVSILIAVFLLHQAVNRAYFHRFDHVGRDESDRDSTPLSESVRTVSGEAATIRSNRKLSKQVVSKLRRFVRKVLGRPDVRPVPPKPPVAPTVPPPPPPPTVQPNPPPIGPRPVPIPVPMPMVPVPTCRLVPAPVTKAPTRPTLAPVTKAPTRPTLAPVTRAPTRRPASIPDVIAPSLPAPRTLHPVVVPVPTCRSGSVKAPTPDRTRRSVSQCGGVMRH